MAPKKTAAAVTSVQEAKADSVACDENGLAVTQFGRPPAWLQRTNLWRR
jgi:hypothetical protein